MIPLAQITQWRNTAPWPDDMQVEQDLILSRLLVDIFSDPLLNKELAFRGGTALHKLFFNPAARYSEDIDLVRTSTGPIKKIVDALRAQIDPWLGQPKTRSTDRSFKLNYYFNPEASPSIKLRIKIEINTRECFSCFDRALENFEVQSDWFSGVAQINTYQFSELIATKLRALYQRKKGRDIFDLWLALKHEAFDLEKTLQAFRFYMEKGGYVIRRHDFINNIELKLQDRSFTDDITPLLSPNLTQKEPLLKTESWNLQSATDAIKEKILAFLPE